MISAVTMITSFFLLLYYLLLDQKPSNLSEPAATELWGPCCTQVWNCTTSNFWMIAQDLGTSPCLIWLSASGTMLDSESRADSSFDLSICLVLFTGAHRDSTTLVLGLNLCLSFITKTFFTIQFAKHNQYKKKYKNEKYSKSSWKN